MRICMVSEREYGCGASVAATRLAEEFARVGHDVRYLYGQKSPRANDTPFRKVQVGASRGQWPVRKLLGAMRRLGPAAWRGLPNWHMSRTVVKAIARTRPHVINIHNVGALIRPKDVIALTRLAPVYWTLHGCFALLGYAFRYVSRSGDEVRTAPIPEDRIDRPGQMLLAAGVPGLEFISPSRWLRDEMRSAGATCALHVIPNGISPRVFHPRDRDEARAKLGLPSDRLLVLVVAADLGYERKNVGVVVEAMRQLDSGSVCLIAVGGDSEQVAKAVPCGVSLGALADPTSLRQAYSAADVLVVPSLIDNLPNTVLEGLFCGTPVLGAEVGGIPEMVVSGKSGWLFDPLGPDDLAARLQWLTTMPAELTQTSAACAAWAGERFTAELQRDRYLRLFEIGMSSSGASAVP